MMGSQMPPMPGGGQPQMGYGAQPPQQRPPGPPSMGGPPQMGARPSGPPQMQQQQMHPGGPPSMMGHGGAPPMGHQQPPSSMSQPGPPQMSHGPPQMGHPQQQQPPSSMSQPGPPQMSHGPPQMGHQQPQHPPSSMMSQPGPPQMGQQQQNQPPMGHQQPPMGHGAPPPPSMSQSGPPPQMSYGGPPQMGQPTMSQSGPPQMNHGPPPMMSQAGPPQMSQSHGGPPPMGHQQQPPSSMSQPGPPQMNHGPPQMSQGPPQMGQGPPQMNHGPPQMGQGPPQQQMGQPRPGPPGMMGGMPPRPPGHQPMVNGMTPSSQPGMPPRPPGMGGQPPQQSMGGMPPRPGMGPPGMGPPSMGGMPPQPGMGGMPPQQGMGGMQPQPGMGPPGMPGMPPQPGMGPPGMGPPGMGGMPPQPGMGGGMAGPPQQQRARLDPSMMPSAIQVMEDDRQAKSGAFQTGFPTAEVPPLVTTDFYCEDQGNCNPRFMRTSLYCAPATQDLLKHSTIPFGAVIAPFANQHPSEHPPPVVNLGDIGPVRCHRCKAYMCPFMEFQDGGRRFRCPFCKCSSDVPTEYFAHLDHQGRRTDIYERPELYCGSVEYVATKEYCKNSVFPKPPAFIFMLDVSYNSVRNGIVTLFCQNIKQMLKNLPKDFGQETSSVQIGFATYDQTIHFYNLRNSMEQPQMMIVGDVGEMFVPMVEGFLVTPAEAESAIEALLEEIPKMFADTRITEVILGPVIQAGMDALKSSDRVGKVFVFHSSLPGAEAPGKLKNREDRKLLGTDKEKTVLLPAGDWYSKLATECVGVGCSVDAFLFPNSFIDVATIGNLCGTTGGTLYKYNYFQPDVDGERFLEDLAHDISRQRAFDAIMRVRTSTGIRPTDFFGSFMMNNTTDVELAACDSDHAITLEIRHDDKLDEKSAFIQAAILFTSVSGQRRLRVHNMSLQTADNYQNLYRYADLDTTVNFLVKFAERMQLQKSPKEVREYLIGRTAQILATYREKCSESAPAGQLILPEVMKLLPLYMNSLIRNDAFAGGSELTTDDRAWLLQSIPPMRVRDSLRFLYPRLLEATALPVEAADSDAWDLSAGLRASYDNLNPGGAFLLENGVVMFLWVGGQVPADWVSDVFGVGSVGQIDTERNVIPIRESGPNRALRRLIRRLHGNRPRQMKLFLLRQGDKLEPWFRKFLVEDKGADNSPSYVDFLCAIHREIRNILS